MPDDAIAHIAQMPDSVGKHAAFMRLLGWSYFEIACAAWRLESQPLTEAAMRHIADHWDDDTEETSP